MVESLSNSFDKAWSVVEKYCGREEEDPYHDTEPPLPIPGMQKRHIPHDIPPLRQLQDESQRFTRTTAGRSPERVKRNDGGTSVSNRKGDSRDDKSSSEKIIDARLNRYGIGGERGV